MKPHLTQTDAEKWAPPFQVRGDVARSLMYMAVSYGSSQEGTPHLELSDSPSIQRRKMGLLSALLRWNELDPPSRPEQLRNDRVCSLYQHNRNPFVNHPEYANLIWRNLPAESSPFTGKSQKAWVNEFHYENKGKDENENSLYAMATSRREPQPNARGNRGVRNMSPGLKPSESDQGLRRARSVPTSPDRRLSPSPASSSSNTCRPASSFNTRTTPSRSTSGSGSSSTHGKTLHSGSSLAAAKQANTMRRKVEKPAATSVWPPALANISSKDMTRTAKSPSTVQKSNLSTKPGIQKMATSSVKLKTHQKSMTGPLGAGKTQVVPLARAPGSIAKRITGTKNSDSIQRTRSVPARQIETPKIEEQDVELLMEFDETESISTSSIEEHLQERLPDPVDLKSVDVYSKPSSSQEEYKNENTGVILDEKHEGKYNDDLSAGDIADVGINSDTIILKEATSETKSKEAVDETELKEDVSATELKESVDETELNEAVSETELNEAIDETKLKEADCETELKESARETELKDGAVEPKLRVQEEAKPKEEKIMLPVKTMELTQRWRKDDGRSNEATEEGRGKPMQERKNKVMALVGRFETAMSGGE